MSQFCYSLILTLLHSLWQSAIIFAIYILTISGKGCLSPLLNKRLLYYLLLVQIFASATTFVVYYFELFHSHTGDNFSYLPVVTRTNKYFAVISEGYAAIILLKLFYHFYKWFQFKSVYKSCLLNPSLELRLFTHVKAEELGISKKISIWLSDKISGPLTYGFFKPVILMPLALVNQLSLKDTESLIIHELTHIRQNDYFMNWLLIMTETIYFFNPFIQLLARRLTLEREKNCDLQVLNYNYPSVDYAETLLQVAKNRTNFGAIPLAAVFTNQQLLQRIRFFTSGQASESRSAKRWIIPTCLVMPVLLISWLLLGLNGNKQESNTRIIAPLTDTKTVTTETSITSNYTERIGQFHMKEPPVKKRSLPATGKTSNVSGMPQQSQQEINVDDVFNAGYHSVSLEEIPDEDKQLIIKEETSGTGETRTKGYTLKYKNGQWKKELLFVMKEGKLRGDSARNRKDSVSIQFIPSMQ